MARLKEKYRAEIVETLMKEFGYSNVMQVPKLVKVVINVGLGESIQNAKAIDAAVNDLTLITGQKPVVTRAKKSIAAFKLREGCRLALWSRCVASECTNSSIAWFRSPFRESGTSVACPRIV